MKRQDSTRWNIPASTLALLGLLSGVVATTPLTAQANSRFLNRLFNRSVPKVLFEGETALARNLVGERIAGGVIQDFRVSSEAIRFRRSFARGAAFPGANGIRPLTREEELMREALTRIENRFIRILRSGRAIDELAVLRKLSRQELDARLLEEVAGSAPKRFFARPELGDTASLFRKLDEEALEIFNRLGKPEGINGLVAPGADLTLIGTREARVWSGIKARGADLRFAQAEILGSDSQGFFRGLDARPLNGKPTNMSFINASGNSMVSARMDDVIAVGAEFRAIEAPGAVWDRIDVRFADLRGADLSGLRSWKDARWEGAIIDARTRLPGKMTHHQAVNDLGMTFDGAF